MKFRPRAVIATAVFLSLAGFAAQGSASTVLPDDQLLPVAATLLQPSTPADVPAPAGDAAITPAVAIAMPAPAEGVSGPDGSDDEAAVADRDGDVTVYPTLAAAVAAQDAGDADSDALRCLAGAVYFESRGEPLAGQLAVAEVVLNRTTSGRFPHDVCGVVTQPAQFSFVRGGQVPAVRANGDYAQALAVARVAMKAAWQSQASRALYFHARRSAPGWNRAQVAAIGNHVFYR